jgi:hypothetical protein
MEDTKNHQELFLAIGLDSKVVDSITKNKKVSSRLAEVVEAAGVTTAAKTVGNLLY